eukprot:scaffold129434_cov63-Phaeocystis_antarctica.AAC.2
MSQGRHEGRGGAERVAGGRELARERGADCQAGHLRPIERPAVNEVRPAHLEAIELGVVPFTVDKGAFFLRLSGIAHYHRSRHAYSNAIVSQGGTQRGYMQGGSHKRRAVAEYHAASVSRGTLRPVIYRAGVRA